MDAKAETISSLARRVSIGRQRFQSDLVFKQVTKVLGNCLRSFRTCSMLTLVPLKLSHWRDLSLPRRGFALAADCKDLRR